MKKNVSVLSHIKRFFEDAARWAYRTASDDELVNLIREDLGLDPKNSVGLPKLTKKQEKRISQIIEDQLKKDEELADLSAAEKDVARKEATEQLIAEAASAQAFAATVEQLKETVEIVQVLIEVLGDDDLPPRDMAWIMFGLFGTGWLEARNPTAHALAQLVGIITSEDSEILTSISPAPIIALIDGDDDAIDAFIENLAQATMIGVAVTDVLFQIAQSEQDEKEANNPGNNAVDDPDDDREPRDRFPAFTGWDPAPDDDPLAADIASRTTSISLPLSFLPDVMLPPVVTLTPVRRSDGGPGALLSSSGGFLIEYGGVSIGLDTTAALSLYIGAEEIESTDPDEPEFAFHYEFIGPVDALLKASGESDPDGPALLMGNPEKTRFELAGYDWRAGASSERAYAAARLNQGKVVVDLADGDGFLRTLVGKRIELEFDIELLWDTDDGLRFSDGSGATAKLPLRRSVFGVFVLQYAELRLEFEDFKVAIVAGVSFDLSFFRASLDQIGFEFSPALDGEPAEFGRILPPSGLGLALDASWVSGGGSLYVDRERGEYFGVLQLNVGGWGVNAIGLITTKRPDGSDGTSMLFMVFLEFEVSLWFGIFWTGAGGVVGIGHQLDTPALESGLKTGALDDLLFPENPVANAPRLLARYRQLFPIEPGSVVAGIALEFSFSKPAIGVLRLGVIAEIKGKRVTEWLLLGLLTIQLPTVSSGERPYLRLTVDVIGGHDSAAGRTLLRGGLRDSFVGAETGPRFTLAGEFVFVRWRPSTDSSSIWAGSIGGWHPDFKLVPPGLPAELEQVAFGFKLGPVTLRFELYIAITPETIQLGFDFELKAKLGPAKLTASLTLDVLIDRITNQFRTELRFTASVKIWGKGISVEVVGTIAGTSLWALQGVAKIKILFKTFTIDINEESGQLPQVQTEQVDAVSEVVAALALASNLTPELPADGLSIVTLAESDDADDLAHPLATLELKQTVLPFEVKIERLGQRPLSTGPTTIGLPSVTIGGEQADTLEPTHGDFAIGQYVDISEEQRLTRSSFDRLPNGVRIGNRKIVVPDPSAHRVVEVKHETKRLGKDKTPPAGRFWHAVPLGAKALDFKLTTAAASFGAAGRSARARTEALVPKDDLSVVSDPALVGVSPETLTPVASLLTETSSPFQAASALAGAGDLYIVPLFELELDKEDA